MKADYEQIDQLVLREQILGMKAGRELDAHVAEKIMNWRKDRKPGGYWYAPNQPNLGRHSPPQYSTDIAAAWEVVEHMQSKADDWDFLYFGPATGENNWRGWHCNFLDDRTLAFGDTMPEAICKAALLAVLEVDL